MRAVTDGRGLAGGVAAVVLSAALLALAACSHPDEHPNPLPGGSPHPSEPPPLKDSAFGAMVGTMEKARGVEATSLQHKEDVDKALQEQEGAAAHE